MRGLKDTLAKLQHHRRLWKKMAADAARHVPRQTPPHASGLAERHGFGSNPGRLRMMTCVPARLPPAAPLVVALHGCTQTAAAYEYGVGWSRLAQRYGFALLMPEQQKSNNPNVCFNWFVPEQIRRGAGEAESIRRMIDAMIEDHDLDSRQVYITGLSAGGAMTAAMLAAYPEMFAGGAIIAGLPYGSASNVQEAFEAMFQGRSRSAAHWGELVRTAAPHHRGPYPRVSIWHGSADATVVPANAVELTKQWANVHGIAEAPAQRDTIQGCSRARWRGPSGDVLMEAYTIPGMAHGVPIDARAGHGERAGAFILDVGISSTHHIARFFGLTEREVHSVEAETIEAEIVEAEIIEPEIVEAEIIEPDIVEAKFARARARPDPVAPPRSPQAVIDAALRAAGLLRP